LRDDHLIEGKMIWQNLATTIAQSAVAASRRCVPGSMAILHPAVLLMPGSFR